MNRQQFESAKNVHFLCECMAASRRSNGGGYDFISVPFQQMHDVIETWEEMRLCIRGMEAFMRDNYCKQYDPLMMQALKTGACEDFAAKYDKTSEVE